MAGIEAYVPTMKQLTRPAPDRKRITVPLPIFPRYVFARSKVRAPGYMHTLSDEQGQPFNLGDPIIQELKKREACGDFDIKGPELCLFVKGDLAEVSFGVLEGWVGRVIRACKKDALLLIGDTRIHLGLDMLKRPPYSSADQPSISHPSTESGRLACPGHLSPES